MRILYLASEKLQIAAVPFTLEGMGHQVGIYPCPMEQMECNEALQEEFERFLGHNALDLVFSNTFYRWAVECTHRYGIPYAVYGMDSPHYGLWQPSARYENVYLFQFDSRECEMLQKYGYRNVRYLPLAARNKDSLVVTDEEIGRYGADISFVGSLYTANAFDERSGDFPETVREALLGMMEENAFRWDGADRVSPRLALETEPYWEQLYELFRRMNDGILLDIPRTYLLKSFLADRKLTNLERNMVLQLLSERYDLKLYTRAEEKVAPGIRRFGEVDCGTDAMKVFYASKINLNLTLRSIETGVPLRVFDIMSVGGFVLTDYREDAAELFEEDQEIVMYRSPEELLDKVDYYLAHEQERLRIGVNGYRRVKREYSFERQLSKILEIVFS
ncbi:MAG: glycosyltransferase [Clostridiales bacterium]|nr:glycosyltransferase [Clostridiales bacterium]